MQGSNREITNTTFLRVAAGLLMLLATTLLTILATTAAAQEPASAGAPNLTGVTWEWRHFVDGRHEKNLFIDTHTIAFGDDGRYTGRADCNSMGGAYTVTGSSISIQPGPSTLMACPPGSLGDEFLSYLLRAAAFSFTENGELLLELPGDGGTLRFAARPQVSGTVTYLQRVALPDDAVVRIQIQDVSTPDAPTAIVAEQVFSTNGTQVPLPFNISYPASAVHETRRYSLSARITDRDGRLLFISDTHVPVITGGSPTSDIEIVLVQVVR